jgi:hypothetical protein
LVWWVTLAESSRYKAHPPVGEVGRAALDILLTPFDSFAGLILAALVIAAGWHARHRLEDAANLTAWGAALIVWSVGLAYTRGDPGALGVFGRYQFLALGFVMLAIVPRHPLPALPSRWAWALVALIVVGSLAQWTAARPTLEAKATWLRGIAMLTECAIAEREPAGTLTAAQVQDVAEQYGEPSCNAEQPSAAPTP